MGLLTTGALVGVGSAVVPVAPAPASAERGDITTFTDVDGQVDQPTDIAVAPDGMVWFTSQGNNLIGRIEPATADIAMFGASAFRGNLDGPNHLTVGPDGDIWFTNDGNDRIGRLDPGTDVVSSFTDPDDRIRDPADITVGPDGNVWFTGTGAVGRITPAGAITTYPLATSTRQAGAITSWFDARLWFAVKFDTGNGPVQRIASIDTTSGAIHEGGNVFPLITDLAVGADGNLWDVWAYPHDPSHSGPEYRNASRLDPATGLSTVTWPLFNGRYSDSRLAPGPDQSLWFVDSGDRRYGQFRANVGRVNLVDGRVTSSPQASGLVEAGTNIASAPDGSVWFTTPSLDRISRVDASGPDVAVVLQRDEASVIAGHDIHYHVTVTNTGTTALTGVVLTDANAPDCARPVADLEPGESTTVDCSITTDPGRLDTYTVTNAATVDTDQTGAFTSQTVSTQVSAHPAVTITQTADDVGVIAGETIGYHLTVTNSGDVPLTAVATSDENVPDCARSLPDLAVGASSSIDCSFETSVAGGTFINTASVDTAQTAPATSNAVDVQVGTQRAMSVATTVDEISVQAGSPIHLHMTVTNDGDIPLDTVAVADPAAPECDADLGVVAAGAHRTVDCTHVTVPADVLTLTNVATVTAHHLDPVSSDPVSVQVTIPPAGFTDVAQSAFYADGVDWAVLFGVVPGVTDTTFRPSKLVARARLTDALFQMMDHPAGSPRHPFADVPRNAWYRHAVDWAVAQGLVSGARPSFHPDHVVSRADVVKLAWLMVGAPTGNPAHGYTDVPGGARYNAALKWAKANGLLDAFAPGSRFKPDRAVTRGQVAYFLHRLALTEAAWPQGPGDPAPPSTVLF